MTIQRLAVVFLLISAGLLVHWAPWEYDIYTIADPKKPTPMQDERWSSFQQYPDHLRKSLLSVSLDANSTRIINDEATSRLPVTIGVLADPELFPSRLIPLLQLSLKHETDVHVFFKNDTATSSEQEFLISYLQQVNRSHQVHVVPVNRVQRMWGMSNVWIVFPVMQYFHDIRPDQKWFVIMDDNTYLLMNAVRRLLMEVGRNTTHGEQPVYMGTPLVDV